MNIRTVVLAFLAERGSAAYTQQAVQIRVDRSQLCDESPTVREISEALTTLASPRMGALVDTAVDPVSKDVVWFATDAGIRRWSLDGRLHVE